MPHIPHAHRGASSGGRLYPPGFIGQGKSLGVPSSPPYPGVHPARGPPHPLRTLGCIPQGYPTSPSRHPLAAPRPGGAGHIAGVSLSPPRAPRPLLRTRSSRDSPALGRARGCGTARAPCPALPPLRAATHAAEQGADPETGPHRAAAAPGSRSRSRSPPPPPPPPWLRPHRSSGRSLLPRLPRGGPYGGGGESEGGSGPLPNEGSLSRAPPSSFHSPLHPSPFHPPPSAPVTVVGTPPTPWGRPGVGALGHGQGWGGWPGALSGLQAARGKG